MKATSEYEWNWRTAFFFSESERKKKGNLFHDNNSPIKVSHFPFNDNLPLRFFVPPPQNPFLASPKEKHNFRHVDKSKSHPRAHPGRFVARGERERERGGDLGRTITSPRIIPRWPTTDGYSRFVSLSNRSQIRCCQWTSSIVKIRTVLRGWRTSVDAFLAYGHHEKIWNWRKERILDFHSPLASLAL